MSKLLSTVRTEWLIPCDLKRYNLRGALTKLKRIDWYQAPAIKNAKVGDFVYIYCSPKNKPGSVCYKGAILEVQKPRVTIDDTEFGGSLGLSPVFEIAIFREYDFENELSYGELKLHGLKGSVQGPRILKGEWADYLHFCDKRYIETHINVKSIPDTCIPVSVFPFQIDEKLENVPVGLDDTHSDEEIRKDIASLDKATLKKLAFLRSSQKPKVIIESSRNIQRDRYVAEYAKSRADGRCQLCKNKAPFMAANGEPYLESHHVIWLSKGGADSPQNTVALCPNCHRKMHYVNDDKDVELLLTIANLEL